MITYNHEKYIEEAIRSVFSQKTNFNIQLVISNDNSTDNTNEVIKRLIRDNESQITVKYIKQDENLGMMDNFAFALVQCEGDYIALCEGDDYWIDDLKLQKQVDFMKSNAQLSFSFHASKILYIN